MFTNWLTTPITTTPSVSSSSALTITSTTSANLIGQLPTNLMTTPPDIVLEVGPSPTIRFVAHSTLLAMHSGYLRSAIRIDENLMISSSNQINSIMDYPPIYLTNVTPEQFGPLLTYMYTGYLDLTLENIFGVLLATHVLHMPRALEICRAFLARSQADGYLNGGGGGGFLNDNISASGKSVNGCKVIRPIASKPILSNLGFIVPPQIQNISLTATSTTGTSFRSLTQNLLSSSSSSTAATAALQHQPSPISSSPIIPIEESSPPPPQPTPIVSKLKSHKDNNINERITKRSPKLKRVSRNKTLPSTPRSSASPSAPPITAAAAATTPATTTTTHQDNENKIIIDVASCDGPVRFRRVLNDSYGRQPDSVHLPPPQHERSHQSVSYSFHQQMAKNISQQREQEHQEHLLHHQHHNNNHHHQHQHQQHHHSEESENSEDLRQNQQHSAATSAATATSNDVYNCVYCKHTFKSQYCYQKHAKRHLNPLSLEHGEGIILAPAVTTFSELAKDEKLILRSTPNACSTVISTTTTTPPPAPQPETTTTLSNRISSSGPRTTARTLNSASVTTVIGDSSTSANGKREVRPLDMNVQYYPCKTCGSKFPSYYFVHKHRKMCHANEEN